MRRRATLMAAAWAACAGVGAADVSGPAPAAAGASAAATAAAPLVRLFELRVDPARMAAFEAVGRANVTASIEQEPGVLAMHATRPRGDASRTWVVEVYADEAALNAHAASAHFKRFLAESDPLLTGKRLVAIEAQFAAEQGGPLRALTGDAAARARLTEFVARGDLAADFRRRLLGQLQASLQREPGLRTVVAATLQGKPAQWRVLEVYADAAAASAARQSREAQAFDGETRAMVMDVQRTDLEPIALAGKGGLRFTGR